MYTGPLYVVCNTSLRACGKMVTWDFPNKYPIAKGGVMTGAMNLLAAYMTILAAGMLHPLPGLWALARLPQPCDGGWRGVLASYSLWLRVCLSAVENRMLTTFPTARILCRAQDWFGAV